MALALAFDRPEGCKRGLWVYEADVAACAKKVEKQLDRFIL